MAPGRRRSGQRPLKRRISVRQPRKTIVIFCEGERTEPEYLEALKRQPWVRDTAAVDLRVERRRGGNDPSTLVRRAVRARLKALEEMDEIDEFWCVFDVEWPENHAGLEEAVVAAKQQGVHLAISNPCFELWLILHFKEHRCWLENDRARRIRRGLDGSGDKGIDADRYMPCVRTKRQCGPSPSSSSTSMTAGSSRATIPPRVCTGSSTASETTPPRRPISSPGGAVSTAGPLTASRTPWEAAQEGRRRSQAHRPVCGAIGSACQAGGPGSSNR